MAGLLTLILYLALAGFIVWAITTYIPMPPLIRKLIYIIVAVVAILWLISLLPGGGPSLPRLD